MEYYLLKYQKCIMHFPCTFQNSSLTTSQKFIIFPLPIEDTWNRIRIILNNILYGKTSIYLEIAYNLFIFPQYIVLFLFD